MTPCLRNSLDGDEGQRTAAVFKVDKRAAAIFVANARNKVQTERESAVASYGQCNCLMI
jgi:hypothetical protein